MAPSSPIYPDITFPHGPEARPYLVTNMVVTLDGKVISGERNEPVSDLGSELDHQVLRQLEVAAGAIMIGAGTLRATPGIWYPRKVLRFVVTASGNFDPHSRFFTDDPQRAYVVTTEVCESAALDAVLNVLRFGTDAVDFEALFRHLRAELGVPTLLCEGGSDLNGQLFGLDLVDEMFMTLAPWVKLGDTTPTYAGGRALPRGRLLGFELVEFHRVADEIFLRYRRNRENARTAAAP
jgi:riboflavin biosynthesis pyrimidine reductase